VYQQDEYLIANQLKEAVEERDFTKVLAITKKPIFSFLENEIVKQLKQAAMSASSASSLPSEDGKEESK
jgi:hypothetical protein